MSERSTEMRTERVDRRPDEMIQGVAYLTPNGVLWFVCPCGCEQGKKQLTMIPTQKLEGYGAHWPMSSENPLTISPSILRKSLDCQSHYFITDGKVVWC